MFVEEKHRSTRLNSAVHDKSALSLGAGLLRVAWFAILLGLAMEFLLLLVATGSGDLFGGAIPALAYGPAVQPVSEAEVVSRGVNEVIFPVGCALILYSAGAVGKRLANQET